MPQYEFELQTSDGLKMWTGKDGLDACRRCADCLKVTVYAWRWPQTSITVGIPQIIE